MTRISYYFLNSLILVGLKSYDLPLYTVVYHFFFQKSFIGAGVKSYDLPFSTKVTDLHTELLRVLNNAKTVSRGNICNKVCHVAGKKRLHESTEGTDQPAHPCSLISVFIINL